MAQVLRTRQAHIDLLEIWTHMADSNPRAADRLLENIGRTCETLAEFPRMGRSRPELAPELRSIPVGDYVIFYRPVDDTVEIVRILYGARDIESIFQNDPPSEGEETQP